MSRKLKIIVEGWRPWGKGKAGLSVDIDKALRENAEAGYLDVKDTGTYMLCLRSALKAIYKHEEVKAEEFTKCSHCGQSLPAKHIKPLTFFDEPEVKGICAADIEEGVPYKPKKPTGRFIKEKDLKKGRNIIKETEE